MTKSIYEQVRTLSEIGRREAEFTKRYTQERKIDRASWRRAMTELEAARASIVESSQPRERSALGWVIEPLRERARRRKSSIRIANKKRCNY